MRGDQCREEHGGREPCLGTSPWAACRGHLGTHVLVLGWTTPPPSTSPSVLPKFEVTIGVPLIVLEKDKKLRLEICGR